LGLEDKSCRTCGALVRAGKDVCMRFNWPKAASKFDARLAVIEISGFFILLVAHGFIEKPKAYEFAIKSEEK
jgi:hypothetical protein